MSQDQATNRNIFDDFGKRIAFIRMKRGLTLTEIANGSASTAKSWESGAKPRPERWDEIAQRVGVSPTFLFLGRPVVAADFDFIAKYRDELAIPPQIARELRVHVPGVEQQVREDPRAYAAGLHEPATRASCEGYVRTLFDRAEASGDANAFPFIYRTLEDHLPLHRFQAPPAKDTARFGRSDESEEQRRERLIREAAQQPRTKLAPGAITPEGQAGQSSRASGT